MKLVAAGMDNLKAIRCQQIGDRLPGDGIFEGRAHLTPQGQKNMVANLKSFQFPPYGSRERKLSGKL